MWEIFKNWIFDVIQFFFNFCQDWGLAIIIVTVIFRILMAPLMHKQARSSYDMQKLTPKLKALKERFPDDPTRQSQEMQKLYAEAKFNPLAGCIPMLFQMPIFIALFQVLREMGDRIGNDASYSFYNVVPNLVITPSQALNEGFLAFIPYLILMLIFAVATFLPMVLQQLHSENTQQRNQTLIMGAVMSLMMLWISWSSPAGVLLFWGTSSLIGIVQNQGTLAYCRAQDRKKAEEESLVVKPIEVNVTRKEKKARPKKKR
jgi:YidC/Oxa1 family membrane protein insertase